MKFVIIYWSRYGNGKRAVEHLAHRLETNGHGVEVFTTAAADPKALPAADRYVFSAPAEKFTVQRTMRRFMRKLDGVEGKTYGIINTHAMERKNWLGKMEKLLGRKEMVKIAAVDFQVGDGMKEGNGFKPGWESKLDAFADQLQQ